MKKILVGEGISGKCEDSLKKMGYTVIKLPKFDRLQDGVASHVDMLLFFHNGVLYTHEEYYKKNKAVFDLAEVKVETTDEDKVIVSLSTNNEWIKASIAKEIADHFHTDLL